MIHFYFVPVLYPLQSQTSKFSPTVRPGVIPSQTRLWDSSVQGPGRSSVMKPKTGFLRPRLLPTLDCPRGPLTRYPPPAFVHRLPRPLTFLGPLSTPSERPHRRRLHLCRPKGPDLTFISLSLKSSPCRDSGLGVPMLQIKCVSLHLPPTPPRWVTRPSRP